MKLFELYATLGLDWSQFSRDVDQAKAKLLEITGIGTNVVVPSGGGTAVISASQSVPASGSAASVVNETAQSAFSGSFWGNVAADAAREGARFVVDYTKKGIERASNLAEAQNVVDVVFGSYTDSLNTWAKNAKSNFGLGELSAKTYAGSFADMLSSVGFGLEEVYTMSTELTELVGDIASFRNQSFETVFNRLYSGMVGETEAIRRYGVNMTVANMEEYAASKGIYSAWKDLSTQEQYALRYDYIMAATKNAQGDFARTLDSSAANQQRLLQENLAQLSTEYGSGFLEKVTAGYKMLNEVLGESAPTLSDTLAAYDEALNRTSADLDKTSQKAGSLIGILEKMEGQTSKTEAEQNIWNSTLRELSNAIPGMSDMIDLVNGRIEGGTTALLAHRDAWLADSKVAAENAAQLEKLEALENAKASLADSQVGLIVAQEQSRAAEQAALLVADQLASAMAMYDGLEKSLYFDGTIESARKLNFQLGDASGWYSGELFDQLGTQLSESLEQYGVSSAEVKAFEGEIQNMNSQLESVNAGITAGINAIVAKLDDVASSVGNIKVTMSAETVGRMVAPTVSREIAREAWVSAY